MSEKSMTSVQVLSAFFKRPEDTLQSFLKELRELSLEEKKELAALAAVQMGVSIKE